MRFSKYIFFILILALLGGCTPATKNFYSPPNLGPSHIASMAHDVAPIVLESYPDLDTIFILSNDAFGKALSYELGKMGYSTLQYRVNATGVPEKALLITYTIDWLDMDQAYIAVNIGNKQRITKKYSIEESGTYPGDQMLIGLTK